MRFMIGLIIGFIMEKLHVTSPIHEYGHQIFYGLNGVSGQITAWNMFTPRRPLGGQALVQAIWGGVGFEMYFFFALSLLIALTSPKRRLTIALFFGIAISAWSGAGNLVDMSFIHSQGLQAWNIVGAILLITYGVFLKIHLTKNTTGYSG